jgi:hypothetical protein
MRLIHSEAALPFAEAMARLDKADALFARARKTYPYVNYIRDGNLWGNSVRGATMDNARKAGW